MGFKVTLSLSILFVFVGLIFLTTATPTGPDTISVTSNTTKSTTAGQVVNISGEYLAKVNITSTVQNEKWKAFVGWVQGTFTLDDSTGSTIYNWSSTTTGGEVYATRNSSTAQWTSIGCASSANITSEDNYLEHTGTDNISSTFSGTNSQTFTTAGTSITAGSCSAINTYVNNASQGSSFEEVLLYDGVNLIFTTILENDATGYDGNTYDFQMIVPENGNSSKSIVTAYYIYVELS